MTITGPGLAVGALTEDWSGDARYFEYTAAADPIRSGRTPRVPLRSVPSALLGEHDTGIEHIDLSGDLGEAVVGTAGPATSPALLASFVHIAAGEQVRTEAVATSELHVVLRGRGVTERSGIEVPWSAGDVLVFPGGVAAWHRSSPSALDGGDADGHAVIYRVTDEPLLRYLGVAPVAERFAPTRWSSEELRRELDAVAADPAARDRNRISVLLAGAPMRQTSTATHVLWAMFGLLPAGAVQRPHRHQSVALDLVLDCEPGCHTLIGDELDADGRIVDPHRVDWSPGAAFVTPPGMWHAHVNDSGAPAHLLPVQDAGLHTYLRSLDIRFARA